MLSSDRAWSWSSAPTPRGGHVVYDRSSARRQVLFDAGVTFMPTTRVTVLQGCSDSAKVPMLTTLCLRSLESSLGKGLATFSLQGLPLGMAENIYKYVFERGSRMAQMEVSRALAPMLAQTVASLDFTTKQATSEKEQTGMASAGISGDPPGNGIIGDSALLELANGVGEGLLRLDLCGCRLVTNTGVLGVLSRCPHVTSLALSGCDRVTDEAIYLIPHRIPYLTKLNLAGLSGVTASGIAYLSFLPSLKHLSLAKCCQVGDEALVSLGRGNCCGSLQWLDLSGTSITDAAVSTSLRGMQLLEYVCLSGTSASFSVVNSVARDLHLLASLPDAPKTRARCNRTLLSGSRWSEGQSAYARSANRNPRRHNTVSLRYGHGTSMRGWEGGPSKMLRLGMGAGGGGGGGEGCVKKTGGLGSVVQVKVGFGSEGDDTGRSGVSDSGRELMMDLVKGIIKLWPAVPSR